MSVPASLPSIVRVIATLRPSTGERLIKRRPPSAALDAKIAPLRLEELLSRALTLWSALAMSKVHIARSRTGAAKLTCFIPVRGLSFCSQMQHISPPTKVQYRTERLSRVICADYSGVSDKAPRPLSV